jgi:hypothetical protein
MRHRRQRRRGLTLIEMVVTFAIGMLILLAVFMIMHSQYVNTEAGREAILEATLARNILTRVSDDIVNSLSGVDPRWLPTQILPNNANQGAKPVQGAAQAAAQAAQNLGIQGADTSALSAANASNGTTGGTQGGTQTTTVSSTMSKSGMTSTTVTMTGGGKSGNSSANSGANASSNNSANASSNSSNSSTSNSASSGTTQPSMPYNLGIKGDAKWIVISSSGVPGTLLGRPPSMSAIDPTVVSSDLRSVSIFLVDGAGLAYKEMRAVTSDEAPTGEPNFSDSEKLVFAPQVTDVQFEYFDGVSWQTTWDGGQLGGNDGNTPIGPPAAIGITITLKSSSVSGDDREVKPRRYKHVVELPSSNAFTQAMQQGQGSSSQLSGQTLINALEAGQMIPPANQQQNGQSSSSSSTTGQ